MFSRIDYRIYNGEVLPKHGPGSVADRLKGNLKYTQRTWTDRLEEYFPAGEYIFPRYGFISDEDPLTYLDPGSEVPVQVTPVPKTMKTPRIIAIEPTCMQYVQQGILEMFVDELRHANHVKSFIDWADQTPNQEMARKGSIDGTLATLDLSEASDRVSLLLARRLFKNHPHLHAGVDSCRSTRADVLGEVINLNKFASMGSALCFPVEAIVFLTIIFSAIAREIGVPLSRRLLSKMKGKVRVYGDDIIVPVEYVAPVVADLEAFGLKVNANKSFWNGSFRESCGKEYLAGYDVSIVRVRHRFPTDRQHVPELISIVSLRNQLFKAGYVETVEWLDTYIERLIPFPYGEESSAGLVRLRHEGHQTDRMHPDLHYPLVRGVIIKNTTPVSKLDGVDALMKFFLKRGEDPFFDKDHLQRAGRAVSAKAKHGWFRPF